MFVSQPFTNFRDLKGFKYFCSRSVHSSSFGYSKPRGGGQPMTVAFPPPPPWTPVENLSSPNRFDSVVRAARARGPFPSPSQRNFETSTLLPSFQQWVKNRNFNEIRCPGYTFLRKGDWGFCKSGDLPQMHLHAGARISTFRKKCQPYFLGIGNIPVLRQYSIAA